MTNNLKPFDLEAALRGEPVVTSDGKPAKVVYVTESVKEHPCLVVIDEPYRSSAVWTTKDGGIYKNNIKTDFDLFMAPKTKTYWINIYKNDKGKIISGKFSYSSKEKAREKRQTDEQYIKTISFEIEE